MGGGWVGGSALPGAAVKMLPAGCSACSCDSSGSVPKLHSLLRCTAAVHCPCWRRYNAMREHQAFLKGRHTCGICLEEQHGGAFVRLDQCRHAWCAGCLAEQARIHVAEGGLERLRWAGAVPACLQLAVCLPAHDAWLHVVPAMLQAAAVCYLSF
jgi:hypothetical protein